MKNLVSIKNITKSYPNFLLDSISMDIPQGEIIGLIGENGAGKTTLISLLLNKLHLESGDINIFGLNYKDNEIEIKQNIGFVVDETYFHSCLNSKHIDNIMKNIYKNWSNKTFFNLVDDFKVPKNMEIDKMSKGMKKKLMLAVALAHNPKLLILDEITSGLDPVIRDDILMILENMIKDKNTTIIFSTHITSDLDKIANKVAFLHKGQLIFYEPMDSLKQKYKLVEYSQVDYSRIKRGVINAEYTRNGHNYALVNINDITSEINLPVRTPTLDDIMLAYIKGGELLCWD